MEQVMIVTVQFTGNVKTYDYVVPTSDEEAVMESTDGGRGVARAVVPNKLKDGVLSLSIANILASRHVPQNEALALNLYPVVTVIPALVISYAAMVVACIDAKKLQA